LVKSEKVFEQFTSKTWFEAGAYLERFAREEKLAQRLKMAGISNETEGLLHRAIII